MYVYIYFWRFKQAQMDCFWAVLIILLVKKQLNAAF